MNCPPALRRPWSMKTVRPWPISAFGQTDTLGNRPMASCFLYNRREFTTLLGGAAAAWPRAALGQALARRPRITLLGGSQPGPTAKIADAFIEGMRALGYTEGRDFEMEYRWAEGYMERLPAL